MTNESKTDIGQLFRERKPIDEALNAAAREAVKRHRQQGQPLVAWRDGQTVLISPDEIEENDADKP
jgi:hypothetical protein